MSAIAQIKAPIHAEMKKFENFFKESMQTTVPLLDIITRYIIRRKGKQMRPMLVFLSAKLCGGVTESTYSAAALIELMHTATLVHDDVVDDSYVRRGFFSIKALWKSKIAVLAGDYLLSRGLLLAVANKEFELLSIVSVAVKEMAEGELIQLEKARKLDITEEVYFDIIYKKTATLIEACTASGADSANADEKMMTQMRLFGKYAGIAFQIKDDLFDYQTSNFAGKPTGNDLKEKKMTLPLIYSLSQTSASEKKKILKIISKHNKDNKKIQEAVKFVLDNGGVEYSEKKMFEYKAKAADALNDFPESDAKTALLSLLNYITSRKK